MDIAAFTEQLLFNDALDTGTDVNSPRTATYLL